MSDGVYTCPCGYWIASQNTLSCAPAVITSFQKRMSGRLLDIRFSMFSIAYLLGPQELADIS
jgi:hypothetical protein